MKVTWPIPSEGSPSYRRRFEKLGDPLLDDFRNFQWLCLKSVIGVVPTEIQYDVGDWLAYGPEMRAVLAYRGHGKSWATSFLVAWLCLRNWVLREGEPDINIVVTSGEKSKSEGFSTFTRDLFYKVPPLAPLIPSDPSRWSMTDFDISGAIPSQVASVAARTVFGRMAGDRADVIIGDDLELPQNAETPGQREKLARRAADFTSILKPGGEIILLGTPHTEESYYNGLSEQHYRRRIWPGRYPNPAKVENYRGDLAPFIGDALASDPKLGTGWGLDGTLGAPTEPTRFDEVRLQLEESQGRARFAMQWMLDTTLSDVERYPLKLRDLIVCDLDYEAGPEHPIWSSDTTYLRGDLSMVGFRGDGWHRPMGYRTGVDGNKRVGPYSGVVCAIDPSGKGTNETAWAIVASMGGFLYLLEHGADVRGYDDPVLAKIMTACRRAKCATVVYEENYGGGMFGSVLAGYFARHGFSAGIEPIKAGVQFKEARILDVLEPVFASHRLVVAPRCISDDAAGEGEAGHTRKLWYQATRLQRLKGALAFDDRVDALAMAVGYWTAQMHVVQETFVAEREAQERSRAIAEFWADVLAGQPVQKQRSLATKNKGFQPYPMRMTP